MQVKADWGAALQAARRGEIEPALAARELDPSGALPDYFFGRCLATAGERLSEAIELLRAARAALPQNVIIPHALALALLRHGSAAADPAATREAASIYAASGLPHDLDLLGQTMLAIELDLRPISADAPPPPAWPTWLETPALAGNETLDSALADASASEPVIIAGAAQAAPPGAGKAMAEIETRLLSFDQAGALALAHDWLAKGAPSGDLHLAAGMAAAELGWLDLACAHLARAMALEPDQQYARTFLAFAHWRAGQAELALALWRSLAVEGPYDYGRHYHLALAHAALGGRAAAAEAMDLALSAFYYDTRHVFIERTYQRWTRFIAAELRPEV